MTPEKFIKNNPFPPNGAEINEKLVADIKDPKKAPFKRRNLHKLLKNNARLIYIIYQQYNYNQTLGSIMSFVYEGLKKATETYNPEIGTKFYHYAVQTIRGILQNYYNYNESLIHIPVMKKRKVNKKTKKETGIKHEFANINDYLEHQYQNISLIESFNELDIKDNDEDDLSTELTMIITEYEQQVNITPELKHNLKIFKLARYYSLRDISAKTGINTMKIRQIIDTTLAKLIKFRKKLNEKLYYVKS